MRAALSKLQVEVGGVLEICGTRVHVCVHVYCACVCVYVLPEDTLTFVARTGLLLHVGHNAI